MRYHPAKRCSFRLSVPHRIGAAKAFTLGTLASVSFLALPSTQAATLTYDAAPGTAGVQAGNNVWSVDVATADWQDSTNTNVAYTQGSDVQFTAPGTDVLTLGTTTIQANSITENTTGITLTIGNAVGNGTIQLGTGIAGVSVTTNNNSGLTFNSNVQLNGSQQWNPYGNGGITVNGNISDTGTSTLTLNNSSGFNGKFVTLNGTNSFGALTLTGGNTMTVTLGNTGNSTTLSGALTLNGTGVTAVLAGTNTITGGTTLTAGTLSIMTDANFGGTASALNFNGGTLQVNGTSLTSFSTRAVTISAGKTANLNIASAANTFNLNTSIAATTGGVAKTGLGNLTISGNNAYTGATSATDGTLTLDYTTNTGTKLSSSSALTLNGATLTSTGTQAAPEVIKGLVIGAGSTLANPVRSAITGNSANTFDFSSGTFTRTAGGVIAFPTSGGPTVKLPGTAGAIVGAGFATIGDNYVSVDANKVVTAFAAYNNDNFATGNNTNVTTTGDAWAGTTINTLRFAAAAPTTTTITGTGTITSGGILVSSAVGSNLSAITGGTLATASNGDLDVTMNNAGTLQIDSTLAINGTGQLVKSGTGGGNLRLTAPVTLANTVNIYDGTVEFANGTGTTSNLNGAVVGAGGLIKSGLGILSVNSGANTYAGPTTLLNGNLQLNNNTATFGNGTGLVTLGDATAANNTVFNFSQIGRTFTNAFATAGTGGTNTVQAQGGGQTFTFTGGFTLGNNLTLSTTGGTDSIAVSTVGIGGTGNLVTNVSTTSAGGTANPVGTVLGTGGTITISSNVNNAGTITNNGNGTAATTISGGIGTNVTGVTQNSATSSLILSGANTYTSATTISAGALQLGAGGATGSLSPSGAITDNGTFIINRTNTATQGTDFSTAAISGSGGLTQAGSGTTTLNVANTYTGATAITAGTLQLSGRNNVIAASSSVSIASGASLDVNGNVAEVVNNLSGAGTITSSFSPTFSGLSLVNGTNTTFSGVINGNIGSSGTVAKSGAGTLTLSGVNTYTAATSITGGTLTLAATKTLGLTSGISAASGTTLALTAVSALNTPGTRNSGGGSVTGQVPISLGGGTLLRNGTGVSLGSQSGTNGTVGIGMLTLTAASTLDFGTTGVGTLNFNSFVDSGNSLLTITDYNRTTAGLVAGTDNTDDRLIFNQNMSAFLSDFSINGQTPTQVALGNGEYELVAAVPEPSTWVAGLLGLGVLGLRLRRRMAGVFTRRGATV